MRNNSCLEELSSCRTALFKRHVRLSSRLVALKSDFTILVQSFNAQVVFHLLKSSHLRGASPSDPLTRGLAPGPHWGTN